jgi:hypothetical protein
MKIELQAYKVIVQLGSTLNISIYDFLQSLASRVSVVFSKREIH